MNNKPVFKLVVAGVMLSSIINVAEATPSSIPNIKITEWMYNPTGTATLGEFVEFTNLGTAAVDFAGWSFDDSHEIAGTVSLTSFGLVAAGESVLLTDNTAAAFRAAWGLASTVKIITNTLHSLGANDEINLYDNTNILRDRLTYSTTNGPSTKAVSGIPGSLAALGANNAGLWVLSTVGNTDGAHTSSAGDIGSPGESSFISAVPVPAATWLFGTGLLGFFGATRKRKTA